MKKIFVYTALALIVTLGSYQLVMARPGQGKENPGNSPAAIFQPISYVQELKLTDDQVNKIGVLISNNNTAAAVLEDKMQANRDSLQILQWSKDFTQAKVDVITKEMQDTMAQVQLLKEKLMVDIKSLLTTEQLGLFNKLHAGNGKGPGQGQNPGQGRQSPMVTGTMINMNLMDKTFTLEAKDPQGVDVTFKVTYTDTTKFVNNKQAAKPEDFINGNEITVMGKTDLEAKTINAMMVQLGKIEPPQGPGQGTEPGKGRGKG
jgi:Spy/CpxP family protein refolding chaperone